MTASSLQSVIATHAGRSVAASYARGLRIAGVRFVTRGVRRTKRVRVVVTLRDRDGLLVRGALVGARIVGSRRLPVTRQRLAYTHRTGSGTLVLRLRPRALGRRIRVIVVASTPSASATKRLSVRLPRR